MSPFQRLNNRREEKTRKKTIKTTTNGLISTPNLTYLNKKVLGAKTTNKMSLNRIA
jgi:hypothetical protein